jgi:hypothetical protein
MVVILGVDGDGEDFSFVELRKALQRSSPSEKGRQPRPEPARSSILNNSKLGRVMRLDQPLV